MSGGAEQYHCWIVEVWIERLLDSLIERLWSRGSGWVPAQIVKGPLGVTLLGGASGVTDAYHG